MIIGTIPTWSKKYVVIVVEMLSSNNKHATLPFFAVVLPPLCIFLE